MAQMTGEGQMPLEELLPGQDLGALSETVQDTRYIRDALSEHKRRGVELAVLARWITLPIVGVFLIWVNPVPSQLYYIAILALLCLNGWFIRRFARVGRSRVELVLILFDLVLMTFGMVVPNPFDPQDMPMAMLYEYGNFIYFFLILSGGTLAYSWRTVVAIGVWTATIWLVAAVASWYFMIPDAALGDAVKAAIGGEPHMWELMDPNSIGFQFRIQEAMVFLLVAGTLALSNRRFQNMLLDNAGLARERANLSRYFSPNVVEALSQNDEPLKQVRSQDVAILFIDIVGFTSLSEGKDALETIELLRGFHGRMETEVFRHSGTLDKYLGDGLMATFGTPMTGPRDATDALECAIAMQQTLAKWNLERRRKGQAEIRAGIGVHYGETVQGDIGANRLEYAVIGDAVNVAARLEKLTRSLAAQIVVSEALCAQMLREGGQASLLARFDSVPAQTIRGVERPMDLRALPIQR